MLYLRKSSCWDSSPFCSCFCCTSLVVLIMFTAFSHIMMFEIIFLKNGNCLLVYKADHIHNEIKKRKQPQCPSILKLKSVFVIHFSFQLSFLSIMSSNCAYNCAYCLCRKGFFYLPLLKQTHKRTWRYLVLPFISEVIKAAGCYL